MKSRLLVLFSAALLVGTFAACKQKNAEETIATADTSQNSLDWKGTYVGVMPCADCEGINISITLNEDNSYKMERVYLTAERETFSTEGTFAWDEQGSVITLETTEAETYPSVIKVAENKLVLLDKEGKEVAGELAENYILTKLDENLIEKYWKLTELEGEPIVYKGEGAKEAFITLRTEGCKVNGNFACNTFGGTYKVKQGNKLSFSQMFSTMMMCPNMDIESKFNKALQKVDSYTVDVDADILTFYDVDMNPVAKFAAVYM
ncbi:copper homeostasis protein (lipoprotein) [Dysgonomonadaceae bacterium PH5-43]|nr:copper homeostasis protein (lipoprotein) [Dysgonomonadaceae bacterium PH5-43]